MNDKLNTDKIIKEKLDDFSLAPPSHVWDNIQTQMATQQRKRRLAYISWIAAAAVVVFAFIAGWFFKEKTGELPKMAKQKQEEPLNKPNKTIDETTAVKGQGEDTFMAETQINNTTEGNDILKPKTTLTSVEKTKPEQNNLVSDIERVTYNLLESIDAIFTIEHTEVYLVEINKEHSGPGITAHDEVLIAENVRNIQKNENAAGGWKIGTLISPGYASSSSNQSKQYAQKINYSVDNGDANVGGGFSVQYKTGKRLHVESGVYYSQNGLSSDNSGSRSLGVRGGTDYLMADAAPAKETVAGFTNTVALGGNGMVMNSPAGVVNMRSAPQGVVVATSAESLTELKSNTLTTSGQFSQVFQFVEIPLYVRYNVLDKRFGIELMGGLNAGVVVGNNAYINNEYGKQNIGSTEDISTLNMSAALGVGMSYGLGKHFSLVLEPRLNYFLNSINSNPDVDFRPYRIGVFTGVYYEF